MPPIDIREVPFGQDAINEPAPLWRSLEQLPAHAASGSDDRREQPSTSPVDFPALHGRQFLRLTAPAAVLDLWDPDRAQAVLHRGQVSTWDAFVAALSARISRLSVNAGTGLRILTESVSSPTLADQLHALLERFPGARWHQYQPINRDQAYEGSRLAFGEVLEARYHYDQARVVLSLDSDFLGAPGVRYAHDFVTARRAGDAQP